MEYDVWKKDAEDNSNGDAFRDRLEKLRDPSYHPCCHYNLEELGEQRIPENMKYREYEEEVCELSMFSSVMLKKNIFVFICVICNMCLKME